VIAAVSLGALGLVVLVATWSRFGPGQSQRRSVKEHQHALDVLGEVAKRRDGIAPVRVPSPEEIGRAHVQPTEEAVPRFRPPAARSPGVPPFTRLVLRSSPKPLRLPIFDDIAKQSDTERPLSDVRGLESGSSASTRSANEASEIDHLVRFDSLNDGPPSSSPADSKLEGVAPYAAKGLFKAEEAADEGHREVVGSRPATSPSPPKELRPASGNPFLLRRIASVAAMMIVLAAVGVGSWQLASSKSPPPRAAAPPASTPHKAQHATHSHSGTSSSPSDVHEIVPTSTSPTIVTFPLSASSFTITFSSSAPCWIGILPSPHGQYLWMTTVEAGTTTTYHATAPVFVRIGAPQYLIVKVNGVRLALPPKKIQPYDVTFTIGSSISA
jgi:hypothetical protein